MVGDAIQGYDREKLILSTKCGLVWGDGAPKDGRDISGKSIMKEIDESLRRLKTDYIDIYHVHKPDFKGTPFEDTMSAMMKLKESGKIRHIGLSNFSIEQTKECMKYGDVEVIQPPFSMIDQRERPVLEFAKENGMGVMTYGSLGAGMLTGTIRTLPNWDPPGHAVCVLRLFQRAQILQGPGTVKSPRQSGRSPAGAGGPGRRELDYGSSAGGYGPDGCAQ